MTLIGVACAGLLGALARFCLSSYIGGRVHSAFPWGTFVINASGSLCLGVLAGIGAARGLISPWWQTVLGTGFTGAYTTFSTWNLESLRLLRKGEGAMALINVLLSTLAGLGAAGVGLLIGYRL
ncbi:MAG: fluoride efflux transporter FluC [Mycobacterium leprae]